MLSVLPLPTRLKGRQARARQRKGGSPQAGAERLAMHELRHVHSHRVTGSRKRES